MTAGTVVIPFSSLICGAALCSLPPPQTISPPKSYVLCSSNTHGGGQWATPIGPDWNLLPAYLLAVAVQKHDSPEVVGPDGYRIERLAALGLVDGEPSLVKKTVDHKTVPGWQTCFKLDVATGDYVRCPVSEWVERSEKAESR